LQESLRKLSQNQNQSTRECFKCRDAGFPGVQISFKRASADDYTGKQRWTLIDPTSGEEHIHKNKTDDSTRSSSHQEEIAQENVNDTTILSATRTLTKDQAKYMDTLGPAIAEILRLCQETNDRLRTLFDRVDKLGGSVQ
jgi:hypothetical protein